MILILFLFDLINLIFLKFWLSIGLLHHYNSLDYLIFVSIKFFSWFDSVFTRIELPHFVTFNLLVWCFICRQQNFDLLTNEFILNLILLVLDKISFIFKQFYLLSWICLISSILVGPQIHIFWSNICSIYLDQFLHQILSWIESHLIWITHFYWSTHYH